MSNKRRHTQDDDPDDSIGSYQRIQAERRALPAWEARAGFLKRFGKTDTLVLTGETGCGKTTQIPQFLLAAGYGDSGVIGITQPRRVAAVAMAQRVAHELGDELGGRVAYQIRYESTVKPECRVKFMTEGILMREVRPRAISSHPASHLASPRRISPRPRRISPSTSRPCRLGLCRWRRT